MCTVGLPILQIGVTETIMYPKLLNVGFTAFLHTILYKVNNYFRNRAQSIEYSEKCILDYSFEIKL